MNGSIGLDYYSVMILLHEINRYENEKSLDDNSIVCKFKNYVSAKGQGPKYSDFTEYIIPRKWYDYLCTLVGVNPLELEGDTYRMYLPIIDAMYGNDDNKPEGNKRKRRK